LINVETLITADHPIRKIKRMCDEVLTAMSSHFDEIYAVDGAPSIPPETLLKGKVLQALYTVRSDRQLCARMQTDLMFRWFVDLSLEAAVFDASTYSKNQARLLTHEVADLFFSEVVELARKHGWVSDDHFSVDGTLIEDVKPAVGAPESAVAVAQMSELQNRGFEPKSVGADKGYHTKEFVAGTRELGMVPHPARKDGQKTLHVLLTLAHAASQKVRKRIEEIFGWAKTTGCFRKSRYRGVERTHAQGQYVIATWNLVRMAKLMLGPPPRHARA
jgi:transposase